MPFLMHLILATALTFPTAATAYMADADADAAATYRTEALLAELHDVNGPYTGDHPNNVTQWRSLVVEHFEPAEVDRAMQVLECESDGDPYAKNPRSSAAGLFQFLRGTWDHAAGQLDLPSYAARRTLRPHRQHRSRRLARHRGRRLGPLDLRPRLLALRVLADNRAACCAYVRQNPLGGLIPWRDGWLCC